MWPRRSAARRWSGRQATGSSSGGHVSEWDKAWGSDYQSATDDYNARKSQDESEYVVDIRRRVPVEAITYR
jgi:hypothetical protein